MWQYIGHGLTILFSLYVANSIYALYSLYTPTPCVGNDCFRPFVGYDDAHQLRLYASLNAQPRRNSAGNEIRRIKSFLPSVEFEETFEVVLPRSTRANGSLWIHVFLVPSKYTGEDPFAAPWYIVRSAKMTLWEVPIAKAFSLVSEKGESMDGINSTNSAAKKSNNTNKITHSSGASGENPNPKSQLPVTHWRSVLPLAVVHPPIKLDPQAIPPEIYHLVKPLNSRTSEYLPIFFLDEVSFRFRDLVEVKSLISETSGDSGAMNLTIKYRPITTGRLRLLVIAMQSVTQMKGFGFGEKDVDEVKGIFTDTNFYLLALTFAVATVHLLLDVLSFKNDVSFWRNRRTLAGLSARSLVWSCFSHVVILLYLVDENTSKIVLVPAGIGTAIEFWKAAKAWRMRRRLASELASQEEQETESFDSQGMRYLGWVMAPLCLGGAVYSLLYVPHKSWYSWVIHSAANGVYAFGFLFMLPQLFINYKLKSVAHLPWRAFMYKAFNTFIDDMFAFIIHMPTTHRLACFRDDFVFLIYLYQRYLYPVDKSRVNEYGESFEVGEAEAPKLAAKKGSQESPSKHKGNGKDRPNLAESKKHK